jgi:hypothetical protein
MLLALLLASSLLAQPGYVPLPDVAASMGACYPRHLPVQTRVYDIRYGHLIELRLIGDPAAEQEVQTPWPREDSLAVVVLTVEPEDPGEFPAQHVAPIWRGPTAEYLVARQHGYFTFGLAGATSRCLQGALGRL